MHEIMHRFTNKCVPGKIIAEQIVAIEPQPAGGSRAVGGLRVVIARQGAAAGKELVRIGVRRDIETWIGRSGLRVAPKIMIDQRIMPHERAVVAAKPVSPVVAHSPLLSKPRGGLEFSCVGTHPKILALN